MNQIAISRCLLIAMISLVGGILISPLLAQPRNMVFILVDDQRHDFLSYFNHPWIKTPSIDYLAKHGLVFDQAYVTTSLCSPSRASIVTGLYAHKHQVFDNDTPLNPKLPNFAEQLQEAGYHTAFIGKWHMGGQNDAPRPGFNYWASFRGQGSYHDPVMNIDGRRQSMQGYTPDLLTDLACSYLDGAKQEDQPFFLFLSHKSIHGPFTPAKRHAGTYQDLEIPRPQSFADTDENYQGKPKWVRNQRKSWHGVERDYSIPNLESFDRQFQLYSECMLAVDESVGRVTEQLRSLDLLDETVIFYYSDNGYLMGEHGLIDKRVMYEPSIRVPLIVHCPELITNSHRDSSFILNIDLAPTFLELAGLTPPPTIQGMSFAPIISNQRPSWRDAFVYEYFCDPKAVQTPTILGLRTKDYSYMTYLGIWDIYELYDMQNDPDQINNLIGHIKYGHAYGTFLDQLKKQDPKLFKTTQSLQEQLDGLLDELGYFE